MGKKFLLYIHHERFSDEPKKSELVNNLLNTHYSGENDIVRRAEEPSNSIEPLDLTNVTRVYTSEFKTCSKCGFPLVGAHRCYK